MKKSLGIIVLCVCLAITALWAATANQQFTITIAPAALMITSAPPPNGQVGVAYSYQETATGGILPYTWSATGLPVGLSIDAASGLISGTPQATCNCSGTVTVTDANGSIATH